MRTILLSMVGVPSWLIRGLLIAVSVLVIAWSAILAHDVRLQARGLTGASVRLSRSGLQKAMTSLRDASLLNADETPRIYRAGVELLAGDAAAALALADRVATSEPGNFAAWRMVALAARSISPGRARIARSRIAGLDPLSAR